MTGPRARRAAARLAVVCAVAASTLPATTGTAAAVEPYVGDYGYSYDDPSTPEPVDRALEFGVRYLSQQPIVYSIRWQSPSCGLIAFPGSHVVSDDRFSFSGQASSSLGGKVWVKIAGTFKTVSKAKVTVRDKDADHSCGKLRNVSVRHQ